MATAAYEGGIGGKSRKRPLRRPSSTPYDRPPSAIRGPRPALPVLAAPEKNGWLSKLVDPASRIITKSASRLFSSVFRKRLAAPPAEANLHSSQQVPAVICANPSSLAQEQGGSLSENRLNSSSADGAKQKTDGAKQKTNSDPNGIGELEQLLKQKTFTRVEFDRLTELVRARTIEPSKTLPVVSSEKEKTYVPEQGKGAGSVGLNGDISNPKPLKEFASPAELAKAYMGSRPSELTHSTLNLKNQIFQDNAAIVSSLSNGNERSDLSVMPRSVVRFSGTPEVTGNGYMTPRLFGRSAMHRMSCSPYFKYPSTTKIKESEPCKDGNFGRSALSQLTTTNSIQSTGKKVNKRRSSVLDGDFGYSGPIRRIRQKSNLISPSRDIRSSLIVNLLSPPLSNDIDHGRATKTQIPLSLDGKKHDISDLKQAKTGNSDVLLGSVDPIFSQSSGIERIPPQQLHELVSSPKNRTSELKSFFRDEIPSKLTTNMLHERALQSMKDIDSSRFFNLQGHGNLDSLNNSYVPSCSSPQKLDGVENITSSKPTVPGVKVLSETLGKINSTTSAIHTKPDSEREKFTISGSAAVPLLKRPAFQMTAPEEEDLDDDDSNSSELFVTGNNKLESRIREYKAVNSVTAVFEKPLVSSAEVAAASSSVLNGDVYLKSFSRPITAKDGGFSFPMASGSETSVQMAPIPTMPSSLVDRSSLQKEQVTGSASALGYKEHAYGLPTTTASLNNGGGATTRPVLECSGSKEEAKYSETTDSLKAAPSSLSSTSGSSVPSLTNGSISLTSSPAYADGVMPFSNASEISILSTSTASSSLSTPFILSTAPLFSTIISNSSTSSPIFVSSLKDSKATVPEPIASEASSPFSTSNSIASVAFPLLNTDKNSSIPASPATSLSMNGSISSVVTSSLFSSLGSDSSALAVASAPNIGNGTFGVTAPAQSINLTLSSSNNTSHNSANFLAKAGSTVGTTESQTGSGVPQFSQPTASQFSSLTSAPAFGLSGSSSSGSSSSSFGPATFGSNPFSSSGVISSFTTAGSSSSVGNSSFGPAAASSLFGASSQSSTSSLFGSSTSSPSSGFLFGQPTSTSSSQTSTSAVGSSTTTGFSVGQSAPVSTSQTPASSILGSTTMSSLASSLFGQSASTSSSQRSTSLFGSNNSSSSTVFPFGESVPSSSQPSSVFGFDSSKTSQAAGFSFGLSTPNTSQPSTSPVFGSSSSLPSAAFSFTQSAHTPGSSSSQPSASVFGSGAPLPSTGFLFGQSAPASVGFTFGASSAPTFSFTSAGNATLATPSSPAPSAFGLTPAGGFGTASPGNDQMNVEDSMADDPIQAAAPTISVFGQANSLPASNFAFDSSTSSGAAVFQFAGQQNSSVPQGASPFQAGGNLQFSSGGSFSLGTADKSGRKVVRVNRNKYRKGR